MTDSLLTDWLTADCTLHTAHCTLCFRLSIKSSVTIYINKKYYRMWLRIWSIHGRPEPELSELSAALICFSAIGGRWEQLITTKLRSLCCAYVKLSSRKTFLFRRLCSSPNLNCSTHVALSTHLDLNGHIPRSHNCARRFKTSGIFYPPF